MLGILTARYLSLKKLLALSITLVLNPAWAAAELPQFQEAASLPLASVGKLQVPAQRYKNGYAQHFTESCSATLVTALPDTETSSIIVSAWHCLEDYRDISRPLLFETAAGKTVLARILAHGGGMHSDWALLRLARPFPFPAVLGTHNHALDDPLVMAGYPRDAGSTLSTDSVHIPSNILHTAGDCRVTGTVGRDTQSDCVLQKGASGGAVFSDAPGHYYLGVISRGDGESLSIFVPLERFRTRISGFFESPHLP